MTDSEPRCNACGTAYTEHLGLEGTCNGLQQACSQIVTKDELLRYILEHVEAEDAGWCKHLASAIRLHLSA